MAGKIAAMSILHDGPGIQFLQEHLTHLMLGMETDLSTFDLDFLPDEEGKVILTLVRCHLALFLQYINIYKHIH